MANGKVQQLKDKLDEKGCFFGQTTQKDTTRNACDINAIGKKMARVYWIAVTLLTTLVLNLVVILFKK